MNPTTIPESALPMERLLYEVKKIIVGQDHLRGISSHTNMER